MFEQALTRHNLQLSRPTMDGFESEGQCAINCTTAISPEVLDLVANSISENTRRAFQSDLTHFECWGGVIPASPNLVASYLAAHADSLSVATLARRVATISKAHESKGLDNPCRAAIVHATMRGIRRTRGTAQRQAKPLLRDDLFAVLSATGDGLKSLRDRALLLIGFAGGFRRSELVGLDCGDVERVRQGLVLTLRKSKTDQDGVGRKIGVLLGRSAWCPVTALERWLEAADIEDGPVFRRINRHGQIFAERLSAEAVCIVVRERVAAIGLEPADFSGHSLRAGLVTSAARMGLPTWKIRAQTGHASDAMLNRYIRDGELFLENVVGALL